MRKGDWAVLQVVWLLALHYLAVHWQQEQQTELGHLFLEVLQGGAG